MKSSHKVMIGIAIALVFSDPIFDFIRFIKSLMPSVSANVDVGDANIAVSDTGANVGLGSENVSVGDASPTECRSGVKDSKCDSAAAQA